ncbi:hypothetical protein IV487_09325 [Enterococcus saccharolyticus]|uniref:Uncharacterized protein n=1 Tax=Candidatus Enterococcus willemsii TaxID=1857215 RepID=A0ABQ6YYY1_9ENTE|nr:MULTISPECIES: hypothetical protein [Enterococcus]KAF1303476.1 hypothetical protein BAU17_12260 [Enterococcus sp. CU12B]MCD5002662.1 hypothetical protein [Enterococcus saccharolyticus]
MLKNGLFLISVGMIFFLYSANAQTGTYNWPNLIVAIFIIVIGVICFIVGNKREKIKKAEDKKHGNR